MNEEKEHNQKIDNFLLGKMTEEDAIAFKKQMLESPELKREVALQEKIIQGLKAHQNQELKRELKKIHKETFAPAQRRIKVLWSYAAVAASIVLIAAIALWLFLPQTSESDLFQAYYQPFALDQSRDPDDRLMAEAKVLYQDSLYRDALPKMDSLAERMPDSVEYQLAIGICYLELQQFEKAKQVFQQIIETKESFLEDQARWYLGLLLIRENKLKAAKEILNVIAQNPNSDKYVETIEIFEHL